MWAMKEWASPSVSPSQYVSHEGVGQPLCFPISICGPTPLFPHLNLLAMKEWASPSVSPSQYVGHEGVGQPLCFPISICGP